MSVQPCIFPCRQLLLISDLDSKNHVHVYITSLQAAAKMIKETMDKKFGATWHSVVGAGFGFEIAYDCKNLLYMFFGGNTAICLWKCA